MSLFPYYLYFILYRLLTSVHTGECFTLYLLILLTWFTFSLPVGLLSPSYTHTGWETVRLSTYSLIIAELHLYRLGDCPALYLLAHYRRVTLVQAGSHIKHYSIEVL